VSVAGSHHVARTSVDLDEGATCTVLEEMALGRSGEPCGRLELDLTVRRCGRTVLRHTEVLGPGTPGWGSVALVGAARHVAAAVVVGPPAGPPATHLAGDGTSAAWLPADDDAALALAVGADRPRTVAALERLAPGGLRRAASAARA
jgi:urease accessory protein